MNLPLPRLSFRSKGAMFNASSRPLTVGSSIHAEMNLLNRCNNKYARPGWLKMNKKYDLTVYRYDKNGNLQNAKPCRNCAHAILESGLVKRVHWSTGDGTIESATPEAVLESSKFLKTHRCLDIRSTNSHTRKSHRYNCYSKKKTSRNTV